MAGGGAGLPATANKERSTAVLVGNLDVQASEKTLREFFVFCGRIEAVEIVETRSKRSAVIRFETEAAAAAAILLDGAFIERRNVRVSLWRREAAEERATEQARPQPSSWTARAAGLLKSIRRYDREHVGAAAGLGLAVQKTRSLVAAADSKMHVSVGAAKLASRASAAVSSLSAASTVLKSAPAGTASAATQVATALGGK
jgi:hypothetical protein